ncbi:hypothetical protein [Aquibacillus salsiterrae]|uniref:Uncharacterized protein n=1 Tax=Aquibacillus salsiterrae TaxID=2950439 RepID=A0A9X3WC20_9BACI|nr:hypothetical protein [Aquibacillus salsiterrae]MDC3416987.1 hypothetical protein [Aquibacillus salsiterrae]
MRRKMYVRTHRTRSPKVFFKLFLLTSLLIFNIMMLSSLVIYFFQASSSLHSQDLETGLIITLILNTMVAITSSDQKLLDYFYLIFTITTMIAIPLVTSFSTYLAGQSNFSFTLLFILLIIGLLMLIEKHRYVRHSFPVYRGSLTFKKVSLLKKLVAATSKLVLITTLGFGVYLGYLSISDQNIILADYAFFFCISLLAITILTLKLIRRLAFVRFLIGTTGITASMLFILSKGAMITILLSPM